MILSRERMGVAQHSSYGFFLILLPNLCSIRWRRSSSAPMRCQTALPCCSFGRPNSAAAGFERLRISGILAGSAHERTAMGQISTLLTKELSFFDCGDDRLHVRAVIIGESMCRNPEHSINRASRGKASLNAAYNFLQTPG